ncbi:MAG: NERD domain-containing protein [Erysipelotrichia bacterium]|nr:NERD domain-containing protein [Erysipelotrichia bacterium]
MEYDYYLINQFVFKVDDSKNVMVDHILFADKFIYVIISQYYEGNLIGKATDSSLVFISHRGKKCYTDNPLNQSKNLIKKLSSATGLNASLLIGIILINDDCKVAVTSESKQFYIIQRKRFRALTRAIEKRPLPPINEQQLEKAVQAIAKANRRKK